MPATVEVFEASLASPPISHTLPTSTRPRVLRTPSSAKVGAHGPRSAAGSSGGAGAPGARKPQFQPGEARGARRCGPPPRVDGSPPRATARSTVRATRTSKRGSTSAESPATGKGSGDAVRAIVDHHDHTAVLVDRETFEPKPGMTREHRGDPGYCVHVVGVGHAASIIAPGCVERAPRYVERYAIHDGRFARAECGPPPRRPSCPEPPVAVGTDK